MTKRTVRILIALAATAACTATAQTARLGSLPASAMVVTNTSALQLTQAMIDALNATNALLTAALANYDLGQKATTQQLAEAVAPLAGTQQLAEAVAPLAGTQQLAAAVGPLLRADAPQAVSNGWSLVIQIGAFTTLINGIGFFTSADALSGLTADGLVNLGVNYSLPTNPEGGKLALVSDIETAATALSDAVGAAILTNAALYSTEPNWAMFAAADDRFGGTALRTAKYNGEGVSLGYNSWPSDRTTYAEGFIERYLSASGQTVKIELPSVAGTLATTQLVAELTAPLSINIASAAGAAAFAYSPTNPPPAQAGNVVSVNGGTGLVTVTAADLGALTAEQDLAALRTYHYGSPDIVESPTSWFVFDGAGTITDFIFAAGRNGPVIPWAVNGVSVTNIADDAFAYYDEPDCSLMCITLPRSILRIGANAFTGAFELTNMTFCGNAPKISVDGFSGIYSMPVATVLNPQATGWTNVLSDGTTSISVVRPALHADAVYQAGQLVATTGDVARIAADLEASKELHADSYTNLVWRSVYSNGWHWLVAHTNTP